MGRQNESSSRDGVIDENLRRVYQEAVEEGVPDRFKSLLDQLKQQDTEQGQEK
jgi:hypothetical protein